MGDRAMRGLCLGFIVVLVLSLGACDGKPKYVDLAPQFFERVAPLKEGKVREISLQSLVPTAWTKACFLGGYASSDEYDVSNSETDWTIVFKDEAVEVGRVQGSYRRLVLNSEEARGEWPCFSRAQAVVVWERGRAVLRAK